MSKAGKRLIESAKQAKEIVELAPFGWGVYEFKCVNCKHKWVAVAPHQITDLSLCHKCGKRKDVFEPTFHCS